MATIFEFTVKLVTNKPMTKPQVEAYAQQALEWWELDYPIGKVGDIEEHKIKRVIIGPIHRRDNAMG